MIEGCTENQAEGLSWNRLGEPVIEGSGLLYKDELVEYTDLPGRLSQKGGKTDYILTVPETYNLRRQINPYRSRGVSLPYSFLTAIQQ